MDEPVPGDATRILRLSAAEDPKASTELLRLLYDELHCIASRQMASERVEHTLQPTALLNEAWVKLFEGRTDDFNDRNHFLATVARPMRQFLVDQARARKRGKRGGERKRVELSEELVSDGAEELDVVAVDRAPEELRRRAPRVAQVVECRFFADSRSRRRRRRWGSRRGRSRASGASRAPG